MFGLAGWWRILKDWNRRIMGTRIHKVLGYGIKDFKGFDKDPRINPEFAEIYDYLDEHKTWDGFCSYAKTWKRKENVSDKWDDNTELRILLQDTEKNKSYSFNDFFSVSGFSSEGKKYPLVLRNILCEDHYRYDDVIDYYDGPTTDNLKWIGKSVFPNDGFVWKKDGSWVIAKYYDSMCFHSVMRRDKGKHASLHEIVLKNILGITAEEFRNQATYKINTFVIAVCDYLEVFKNPLELYNFKPCIYTYWD